MSELSPLFHTPAGAVWQAFATLSAVPRPSKHEAQVSAHLKAQAAAAGWSVREDAIGNLVVVVPGSGRLATAPPLILQGHMDMVCEKNADVDHDFMADPIRPRIDGDWIVASGTTLGADNGIAIALALAVAALPMPDRMPLELLFTVDEETGLTGAMQLDPSILTGRRLLNLDSEEDGIFTVGCAGGVDLTLSLPVTASDAVDGALSFAVTGLRGGHSGVNIHEGRGNAIRAAAALVCALRTRCPDLILHALSGGNKKNAIPREAVGTVSGCSRAEADAAAADVLDDLWAREARAHIRWREGGDTERMLPAALPELLLSVPCGVVEMDPNYDDLVQTSNSIGVLTGDDRVAALMHGRSSSRPSLDALVADVRALAAEADAELVDDTYYPGWAPNPDSALLQWCTAVWAETFGAPPEVGAIHAGLESGIIGDKIGTAELLSAGPTIEEAHSPDERLHIESTARMYTFLQRLVASG
jgi:dipeptidase D